jgi:hypothetical protein
MNKTVIFIVLLISSLSVFSQEINVNRGNPESAGVGLRLMILNTLPQKMNMSPDNIYPNVYGVITDWNIGDTIASIVSIKDGTASLYTTSTFGIIGGQSHDNVKSAALEYVRIANQFYTKANIVKEFPYPKKNEVFYYLLTYNGVIKIIGNMKDLEKGKDKTLPLFNAAQNVLSELHNIMEK